MKIDHFRLRLASLIQGFCKGTFKFSLPVCAWVTLWVSSGLMLVHCMSFWEPCTHSLWLSLSLCFSGHVICSPAALFFLLLTPPLRTLTSCWLHVDLWPTSLSFFVTSRAFLILYFGTLENPTFLTVRSVTKTPHTNCVLSTPWEGGGVPRSLTVSVCVHHPILYSSCPLCTSIICFLYF